MNTDCTRCCLPSIETVCHCDTSACHICWPGAPHLDEHDLEGRQADAVVVALPIWVHPVHVVALTVSMPECEAELISLQHYNVSSTCLQKVLEDI